MMVCRMKGPWKKAWGNAPRQPAADQDIRIKVDKCGVTFIHNLEAQQNFKKQNFLQQPRRCTKCIITIQDCKPHFLRTAEKDDQTGKEGSWRFEALGLKMLACNIA
jgi:hypothetical protein